MKRDRSINYFLLFACFLIGLNTFSQSFYVDGTNGNDNNAGTSLAKPWKTIQNAFDNATPGSTVFIRGGTYNENVYGNVSGTPGNPITYTNYQNEIVILDGAGTSQAEMLYIENQNYLVIKNITVQNKVAKYASGITVSATANGGSSNITLKNIKITGINWTTNANAIPTSKDNSNPLVVYGEGTNQSNAITNILIDSCEIYNNITGFSESLTLDGNVDTFIVSNNRVHDNKNIGILMGGNYQVSATPALDHARNGKCFRNTCYNNVSNYATSAGIYVDGGQNNIVEHNTCYGNGFGIEIGCEENGSTSNIFVRNNIIYNNKEAGLSIGGYTSSTTGQVLNCKVLNNTFLKNDYSNSGNGELYITKMSNCTIENNIFYTNAQNSLLSKDNISPFGNNSINYNCWFTPNNNSANINVNWNNSTFSSFANYKSTTGMEANSIYNNPELINDNVSSPDFHISNTSVCIDAGNPTFFPDVNELDFYGNQRVVNSRVDMGVNEFSPTTSIPANYLSTTVPLIYPNPSTGLVFIQTEKDWDRLEVINLLGQKVVEKLISSRFEIIDLSDLPGVYLVRIISANKILSSARLMITADIK